MLEPDRNWLALDFDGVLCDSATETAATAWRASRRWAAGRPTLVPPAVCIENFRAVRPILEVGYEAIILMRLVEAGTPVPVIAANFPKLAEAEIAKLGTTIPELTEIFAKTRDQWIEADEPDWLAHHSFYPGTLAALRRCLAQTPVFIITTKQERFARQLLRGAGIDLPADRLWGLERGLPKEEILHHLVNRPELANLTCHFVEDRLPTLERVARRPGLEAVCLHLATWGYCTADDIARARQVDRLHLLDLGDFLAPA